MSGLTAGGLPYATGTDLVRDGDNAIKALADALQARGQANEVQSASSRLAVTGGNVFLTFPHAFKAASVPVVVAIGQVEAGFYPLVLLNGTPGPTGVQLFVREIAGGQPWGSGLTVNWVAIGPLGP